MHHLGPIVEWCHNLDERKDFIKRNKPSKEIPIRLKWMRMVKGKLPAEVVKWAKKIDAAWQKYDATWQKYIQILLKHKPVIDKLFQEECPGCPWDGRTLFPKDSML